MPRIGIDAMGSNAHLIPRSTEVVFGYATGSNGVQWTPEQFAGFPHSGIGRIVQNDDPNPKLGHIFDIEQFAGDVTHWVTFAEACRRVGIVPVAYGGRSTLSDVATESALHGIVTYYEWEANPGIGEEAARQLLGGRVKAVQFAWPTTDPHMILPGSHLTLAQANCDVSIVADDFLTPPHTLSRPHGVANAHLSVDLVDGKWHVAGTTGNVRLGDKSEWWEAHVGINRKTGHWRVEPMPGENR